MVPRNTPRPAGHTAASSMLRLTVLVAGLLLVLTVGLNGVQALAQTSGESAAVPLNSEPGGPAPAVINSDGSASVQTGSGVPTTPEEILRVMKYWLIPFVLASVVAVWIVFERLVVLRRSRVIPSEFTNQFMDALKAGKLDAGTALAACEKNGSPLARVFEHVVRKWGKPSVELEQAVIDGGERQVALLRRHLRGLNGVATITPLIGLFGTVVGMIQSFNEIAQSAAMGNAELLAAGIATALLTTAFGLTIAIPATVMHLYLTGRVDELVTEIDDLSQRVVWLVSAEALQSRPVVNRPRVKVSATAVEAPKSQAVASHEQS